MFGTAELVNASVCVQAEDLNMAAHEKKKLPTDESSTRQSSKPTPPIDELIEGATTRQSKGDAAFKRMRQQADALDRVLTENGDPEYDWASG
ncbi:MAG TPA: hypothetical protein V6C89_05090 [Drouetiella sp.]